MYRIGIISAGGSGKKRTIPALADSNLCSVSVIHSRQVDRFASSDAYVVDNLEEFRARASDLDVVYIASPPFLHAEHIEFALSLNKAIICEKPLVTNKKDLDRVITALTQSPQPFMLAHHLRHQPAVADIRQTIQTKRLGAVSTANLQWSFWLNHEAPSARWKLDPALGGSNSMFDAGVHAVDLAVYLFGMPIRVGACGNNIRSLKTTDSVVATFDYGTSIATVVSSQSASLAGNDLSITFEQGAIHAPAMFSERSSRRVDTAAGPDIASAEYPSINLYRAEVEAFCESLSSNAPLQGTSFLEAVTETDILLALEQSLATNGSLVPVQAHRPLA